MTEAEKRQLKQFEAKARQLISSYNVMKQENADLYNELDRKDQEIASLKVELAQSRKDYETLKLARMMQISDNELKQAKQRITRLVREVNKCISILSAENSDNE